MKRSSTIILQVVIVLIGIGAVAALLWGPRIEGRNAHTTNFEIYFKDPFLAYAYIASIPFFVALYQAFKALRYAGRNKIFSPEVVKALRTIKYCALAIIGFVAGGEIIIIMLNNGSDDPAGGVFVGLLIACGAIMMAITAAKFERFLRNAAEVRSKTA